MPAAARCGLCGTNFPIQKAGDRCEVCDPECAPILDGIKPAAVDEDWMQKVNQAKFERYYEETRGVAP